MRWRSFTYDAALAGTLALVFAGAACARPVRLAPQRVMAVTLAGESAATLPVALRRGERSTPVLMIAARGVQNPRAAQAYVRVLLASGQGAEEDLGSFTFFGAPPGDDEQLFAFALEPHQLRSLANHSAQIRTVLKSMGAAEEISGVRIELEGWVETSVPPDPPTRS